MAINCACFVPDRGVGESSDIAADAEAAGLRLGRGPFADRVFLVVFLAFAGRLAEVFAFMVRFSSSPGGASIASPTTPRPDSRSCKEEW
jgi:hypothetical protein